MPPAPSSATISYGPRCNPAVSSIVPSASSGSITGRRHARQPEVLQQRAKPWIGPQRVKNRRDSGMDKKRSALFAGLFEIGPGVVKLLERNRDDRQRVRRDVFLR